MTPCLLRRPWPAALTGLLVLPVLLSAPAAAGDSPTRADPLDARATVPAQAHDSPFSDYRRLGDARPLPWREANDRVARIGGWRAYAREANARGPESRPAPGQPAATPSTTAPVTPPGHAGHGAHP